MNDMLKCIMQQMQLITDTGALASLRAEWIIVILDAYFTIVAFLDPY